MDQNQKLRRRVRTPKRSGNKCVDCVNSIFDDQWGEYKCRIRQIRITNPVSYTGCKHYVKETAKK